MQAAAWNNGKCGEDIVVVYSQEENQVGYFNQQIRIFDNPKQVLFLLNSDLIIPKTLIFLVEIYQIVFSRGIVIYFKETIHIFMQADRKVRIQPPFNEIINVLSSYLLSRGFGLYF